MANNVTADPGSGGSSFNTTDLDTFTSHSTGGQLPGALLYTAADASTEPTSVTTENPLPTTDGNLGAKADSAATTDTGTFSLIALFKRLLEKATAIALQLPAALTGSGNLKVSLQESNATQAVTQSGTWTVQPGNTANTTAWLVTGTGGTFPVTGTVDTELPDAAALADNTSNPTVPGVGAFAMVWDGSTWDRVPGNSSDGVLVNLGANNDITIGAALPAGGNTIGDVTISGSALTALQLIDDPIKTDDAAFVPASDKVLMVGATFDDVSSDTVDDGDAGALRMSTRRELYVQLRDSAGNERGLAIDSNNRLGANVFQSTAANLNATVVGTGTFVVQVDGAALTALQLIDDPVFTDDAAFTPGTSKVMVAGFQADESSTDSIDEGDAGAARMTLDRKVIVTPQPHTTGGLSIFRSLDLDETEEEAKATAGQVYGWYFFNASTSVRYLKFYNATAANVTVGTTTPVMTVPLPAASSGGVGGNVLGPMGIAFDTAITVAVTTGLADNDSGAPSANDVILNLFYK